MRKPLLVAICQFVCLNHHERRKLTPDQWWGVFRSQWLTFWPEEEVQRYKGYE